MKAAARKKLKRCAGLVRDAVDKHPAADENSPTAYELAAKAGRIGVATGAPRDLSTNRKYFDGFGESETTTA